MSTSVDFNFTIFFLNFFFFSTFLFFFSFSCFLFFSCCRDLKTKNISLPAELSKSRSISEQLEEWTDWGSSPGNWSYSKGVSSPHILAEFVNVIVKIPEKWNGVFGTQCSETKPDSSLQLHPVQLYKTRISFVALNKKAYLFFLINVWLYTYLN